MHERPGCGFTNFTMLLHSSSRLSLARTSKKRCQLGSFRVYSRCPNPPDERFLHSFILPSKYSSSQSLRQRTAILAISCITCGAYLATREARRTTVPLRRHPPMNAASYSSCLREKSVPDHGHLFTLVLLALPPLPSTPDSWAQRSSAVLVPLLSLAWLSVAPRSTQISHLYNDSAISVLLRSIYSPHEPSISITMQKSRMKSCHPAVQECHATACDSVHMSPR